MTRRAWAAAFAAAACLGCCGTASAFVVPPSAALFGAGARCTGGLFPLSHGGKRGVSRKRWLGSAAERARPCVRARAHTQTHRVLTRPSARPPGTQGSRLRGVWRCRASVHRRKRIVSWWRTCPVGAPWRCVLACSPRLPAPRDARALASPPPLCRCPVLVLDRSRSDERPITVRCCQAISLFPLGAVAAAKEDVEGVCVCAHNRLLYARSACPCADPVCMHVLHACVRACVRACVSALVRVGLCVSLGQ